MESHKEQKAQATHVFRVHAVLISSSDLWANLRQMVGGDFLVPEFFGVVPYKHSKISTFFLKVGRIPVFNQITVVSIYPKRSEG